MNDNPSDNYLLFRRGRQLFGVSASLVEAIVSPGSVPPLPLAPPWILGIYVHEEAVLPVIDLRFLVDADSEFGAGPFGRLILLYSGQEGVPVSCRSFSTASSNSAGSFFRKLPSATI